MLLPDTTPVKIWSVIVTLFGDLAAHEGDEMSGTCLGILMEHLGFKPDAARVALHRLRKDGWIDVRKQGRQAYYRLSEFGLSETAKASPRIYSAPAQDTKLTIFALPESNNAHQHLQLAPTLFVAQTPPENAWPLQPKDEQLPTWLRSQIAPPALMDSFVALETSIRQKPRSISSPIADAVNRAAIIHPWRRLILRVSNEAEILLGECHIQSCRHAVMNALKTIPRPNLNELHQAI